MALISILKWVVIALSISSYKSIPLAYYFRFYWVILKNVIFAKWIKQFRYDIKSPFQISELKTYNSPFECDFYFHKSNSSYAEELDIARSQLLTSTLQKFFLYYPTESKTWPFIPVASIFTSFKKEIKPFAKYTIKSRILAWDSKWLFILSKFVITNGKSERVASATITKYVLKDGRKTIEPAKALKFEGLWSEELEKQSLENLKLVDYFVSTEQIDEFPL